MMKWNANKKYLSENSACAKVLEKLLQILFKMYFLCLTFVNRFFRAS